jgi:hypothetical protein
MNRAKFILIKDLFVEAIGTREMFLKLTAELALKQNPLQHAITGQES